MNNKLKSDRSKRLISLIRNSSFILVNDCIRKLKNVIVLFILKLWLEERKWKYQQDFIVSDYWIVYELYSLVFSEVFVKTRFTEIFSSEVTEEIPLKSLIFDSDKRC